MTDQSLDLSEFELGDEQLDEVFGGVAEAGAACSEASTFEVAM